MKNKLLLAMKLFGTLLKLILGERRCIDGETTSPVSTTTAATTTPLPKGK